jgi:hypothetical protein
MKTKEKYPIIFQTGKQKENTLRHENKRKIPYHLSDIITLEKYPIIFQL